MARSVPGMLEAKPLTPKLVSRVPAELYRHAPMVLFTPPPTRILPSGCKARLKTALPPVLVRTSPPLPKVGSRLPTLQSTRSSSNSSLGRTLRLLWCAAGFRRFRILFSQPVTIYHSHVNNHRGPRATDSEELSPVRSSEVH